METNHSSLEHTSLQAFFLPQKAQKRSNFFPRASDFRASHRGPPKSSSGDVGHHRDRTGKSRKRKVSFELAEAALIIGNRSEAHCYL